MVVPPGVTHEEGHTGFLRLPSAVPALIVFAKTIQPFLSLVDREVEFCPLRLVGHFFFFFGGKLSGHVTASRFELMLPTEPLGRTCILYFYLFIS